MGVKFKVSFVSVVKELTGSAYRVPEPEPHLFHLSGAVAGTFQVPTATSMLAPNSHLKGTLHNGTILHGTCRNLSKLNVSAT